MSAKKDKVAIAGDGQVTLGDTVIKHGAKKIRRLYNDKILAGFAGSSADSVRPVFPLRSQAGAVSRESEPRGGGTGQGLADRPRLRHLEAVMIVADDKNTFLISGNGDLIEPDDGIVAIGSGGAYALAAARALGEIHGLERARDRAGSDADCRQDLHLYEREHLDRRTVNAESLPLQLLESN